MPIFAPSVRWVEGLSVVHFQIFCAPSGKMIHRIQKRFQDARMVHTSVTIPTFVGLWLGTPIGEWQSSVLEFSVRRAWNGKVCKSKSPLNCLNSETLLIPLYRGRCVVVLPCFSFWYTARWRHDKMLWPNWFFFHPSRLTQQINPDEIWHMSMYYGCVLACQLWPWFMKGVGYISKFRIFVSDGCSKLVLTKFGTFICCQIWPWWVNVMVWEICKPLDITRSVKCYVSDFNGMIWCISCSENLYKRDLYRFTL